jgi:hypothetical protein
MRFSQNSSNQKRERMVYSEVPISVNFLEIVMYHTSLVSARNSVGVPAETLVLGILPTIELRPSFRNHASCTC